MTTRDRVIETIAGVLEIPAGEIEPSSRFVEDLGATSLDIVNLIWRVEEVFALGETPESVLEGLETVGDLVDLVDTMRSSEPSEATEVVDVVIAADHAGVELKADVIEVLRKSRHSLIDLGPAETTSVDYPAFAELVATRVARGDGRLGILICGSGIGMSIAANKVPGVRAALVSDPVSARSARQHNDANVLCLGSRIIGRELALACVEEFVSADFDPGNDGRHRRRVNMITDLEEGRVGHEPRPSPPSNASSQ